MTEKRVIVVGSGASGMMAAGRVAESGSGVLLLEKTGSPGKKILISGKTRCNLTNTRELDDFIEAYGANGRFLYSAFGRFFRDDLLLLLKRYGVDTRSERGGRVFPVSDDARDVVKALERYMLDNRVQVQTSVNVNRILVDHGRVVGVQSERKVYPAGAVIVATGGASFPATGSTGDGYRLAATVGHTITRLRPALVPLVVSEIERARSIQGAGLRNVRLTSYQCMAEEIDPEIKPISDYGRGIRGKKPRPPIIESRMGEMIITHFGLGGPITLQMSLAIVDALERGPVSVSIDLKPALSDKELRDRLQRDFDRYSKRTYRHILKELLPQKLIEPFVEITSIPRDKRGHEIASGERERLLRALKSLRFNIKEPLPMASAMVTAGGISLKEVDPHTMSSRIVSGLYLCGEVLDLDAETGGYNLQAAFSTGYVAGESATHSLT